MHGAKLSAREWKLCRYNKGMETQYESVVCGVRPLDRWSRIFGCFQTHYDDPICAHLAPVHWLIGLAAPAFVACSWNIHYSPPDYSLSDFVLSHKRQMTETQAPP